MPNTYVPNLVLGAEPAEHEITWVSKVSNLGDILGQRWQTSSDLEHRSNPASGDLRNQTQSLLFLDFRMTEIPETISGIELRVVGQRNGRITDQVIQLVYQGQPIGENNFNYVTDGSGHLIIRNDTTYGGPTDLWGTEVTAEMLQDPSFGVMLKFQSHPYYPHKCGMFLDSVSLTIY